MAEIVNLIQEEQLFGVHWDTQPIGKVLKEILTLFQDQYRRISKIENKISLFVEKPDFEKLNNNILDLEGKTSEEFNRVKKEAKENQEKMTKELNNVKDYIDNNNLTAISESRRLITNEIANYVPHVYEIDPVIVKLNENLKENVKSIKKLKDDFDSITIPPASSNEPYTLDRSAVRVIQCEKKISELESVVQNYPSLESELLNIQLQFPNSIQKLERKINDIQSALESKINLKIAPVQSTKDSSNPSSNQNSLPATPKTPQSNGGSAVSSFIKVDTKSEPPIEIEFDNSILQPSRKIEMPDILPDLKPNPLLEKIKFNEQLEKKNQEMVDLIKSIPSNSHAQPSFKDDAFEIETLPNDQVVKIYETHTHVSELQSSVRVVSELEWCTQAINQHHEAIRQIQQSLRTQQDNFDTITENLMRVNSTNNTRISQLAQQNLHQNQDIDELRRQVSDQLNKLQTHIYKLQQRVNDGLNPSNIKKGDENDFKTESIISPSSSLLKKKTVLPPLSNGNILNGEKSDSDLISNDSEDQSGEDDKNKDKSKKQDNESDKNDKKDDKEKTAPKKHNFTIYTTHFTANMPKCKAHTIFSTIGTDLLIPNIDNIDPNAQNDKNNHNRIDHIDLYNSTIKPIVPKVTSVQVPKTKSEHSRLYGSGNANGNNGGMNDDEEFISSRQIDNSKYNKGPIVYGDIINLTRPYSSRQEMMYPNGLEALGLSDSEITEMIEDKVSMVARKTIAILADHAKEKMNEQAREVKKSIDQVISLVDGKIDRDFVERMFNKFRVMINEMNEKIDNLSCSFLEWVTRDELEMVLQKFVSIVTDVKDAAATKAKYNCLLCGRPRQHLAGMMIGNVLPKSSHDDSSSPSQIKQRQPKTVPPTALKPTRKISTGFQPDDLNDKRKRGQTALGNQHQQVPRDVVQFLTTS